MNISASSQSPHAGFLETQHSCSGSGQQAGSAQLATFSISLQINPFLTPPYQPNLIACLTLPFSASTEKIIQACATRIYLLLPFISHPQHKAFCQATARAHLSNALSSLTCIFHQQFSKQSAWKRKVQGTVWGGKSCRASTARGRLVLLASMLCIFLSKYWDWKQYLAIRTMVFIFLWENYIKMKKWCRSPLLPIVFALSVLCQTSPACLSLVPLELIAATTNIIFLHRVQP